MIKEKGLWLGKVLMYFVISAFTDITYSQADWKNDFKYRDTNPDCKPVSKSELSKNAEIAVFGTSYDKILIAMSYGLCFKAKDEEGNLFRSDIAFLEALSKEFESTLINDLVLDPIADYFIMEELKNRY